MLNISRVPKLPQDNLTLHLIQLVNTMLEIMYLFHLRLVMGQHQIRNLHSLHTGPWDWVEYEANADFEFDVVPLPIANETGTLSPASYLPIGLNAESDYPEEAWELLKYLTYGEGQDIQAAITGSVPVVERNVDHVYELAGAPDNAESLVNQLQDGSIVLNVPYHPDFPEIESRLTAVVETLNLNNTPVEEPINELADEVRTDFDLE